MAIWTSKTCVRRLNGEEDLIRAGEDAATGQGYPSVNKLLPTYHRYLLLGKHLAGSVVLSCRWETKLLLASSCLDETSFAA